MGLIKNLTPDKMLPTYRDYTPEFLLSQGIRALLIDIDNTLAPYEQPDPDENIQNWFKTLSACGIRCALVSNNHKERVERFNRKLGLIAHYNAHKPMGKVLKIAMSELGSDQATTAVLGDQLLTDVYAGKHIGLKAFCVPPIKDKTNLFFRAKRFLERPIIRRYAKKNGYEEYMKFWKVKP